MKNLNIKYFIKEGIKNILRNKAVSINSILTISLALLVFSIFLMVSSNIRSVISNWEETADLTLYLKDNIAETRIAEIKDEIHKEKNVREVKFVPKEEALKKFSEDEDIKHLIEILEENPLPNIIEIYLKRDKNTALYISSLSEKLKVFPEIDDIQSRAEIAQVLYTSKTLGLILSLIFLFLAMMISSNTIKLTVLSKETEIEIMKLVGATPLFIRLPFITEGIIKGIISSLLSIFFLYIIYFFLNISFDFSYLITINFISPKQIILIILTGGLLGCLGALMAIRKFLKF